MKRTTLKNRLFSIAFTLLLGPGVGHIYLKYFKQAVVLIILSILFAIHQMWYIIKASGLVQLNKLSVTDISQMTNSFSINYPNTMLYFDAVFAAIWAYAVVDCYKKSKITDGEEPQIVPGDETNEEK